MRILTILEQIVKEQRGLRKRLEDVCKHLGNQTPADLGPLVPPEIQLPATTVMEMESIDRTLGDPNIENNIVSILQLSTYSLCWTINSRLQVLNHFPSTN